MEKLQSCGGTGNPASPLARGDPDRPVVRVCLGPGCLAQGADKVSRAFKAAIQETDVAADVNPSLRGPAVTAFAVKGPWLTCPPIICSTSR